MNDHKNINLKYVVSLSLISAMVVFYSGMTGLLSAVQNHFMKDISISPIQHYFRVLQ